MKSDLSANIVRILKHDMIEDPAQVKQMLKIKIKNTKIEDQFLNEISRDRLNKLVGLIGIYEDKKAGCIAMMYLIQSKFSDKSYTLAYDLADTTGKRRWDNQVIRDSESMNWSTPAFAGFFDKNITTLFGPDFRQLVDLTGIKF